ncbi:MAG: DNA alkylation repair protein [Clostridiales Family XIII bacterium]|nr:DNA alkylation repair protein [Clostridiales Family XIII bacterium]
MQNIRKKLKTASKGNEKFANFSKKIIKTKKKIIGVRTPDLRQIAKEEIKKIKNLHKDNNNKIDKTIYEKINFYLDNIDKNIYEEIIFIGMLINYSNIDDKLKIKLIRKYLKFADSWAYTDLFNVEKSKLNDKAYWNFVLESMTSKNEFLCRFGIVFAMKKFLDDKKIDYLFGEIRKIRNDSYYVKMGIAWFYAEAGVNFYDKTLNELTRRIDNKKLKENEVLLDKWTYNKSLTKMAESRRYTAEQKKDIRGLKL